jgi:tetratricopeptide (TPR) repeat protein
MSLRPVRLKIGDYCFKEGSFDQATNWFEKVVRKDAIVARQSKTVQSTHEMDLSKYRSAIVCAMEKELQEVTQKEALNIQPVIDRISFLPGGKLYNTYQLYRIASLATLKTRLLNYLQHFPVDTIKFADRQDFGSVAEILPRLVSDKIWTLETLSNVIWYWIWQYPDSPVVETLLLSLAKKYPDSVNWHSMIGELYHRRGDFQEAIKYYSSSTQLSPQPKWVSWRLLNISQTHTAKIRISEQQPVKKDSFPSQLPGLVGHFPTKVEQKRILLDTMSRNINWEWCTWATGDSVSDSSERTSGGEFAGGIDNLDLQDAIRIDGFWRIIDKTREPPRAGFWPMNNPKETSNFDLLPNHTYLITFLYRTDGLLDSQATVYLCDCPDLPFRSDHWLPATEGQWRRYSRILYNSSSKPIAIRPLLRNWGVGRVWFADLKLVEISLSVVSPKLVESPWEIR